jgi:hypothetical protein
MIAETRAKIICKFSKKKIISIVSCWWFFMIKRWIYYCFPNYK